MSAVPENFQPYAFKAGKSGNPKGRPKGTRNKLSTDFLNDLREAWNETYIDDNGKEQKVGLQAIRQVLRTEPAKALAVMTQVLPKDFQLTVTDAADSWVINASPSLTSEEWRDKALEHMDSHQTDGSVSPTDGSDNVLNKSIVDPDS